MMIRCNSLEKKRKLAVIMVSNANVYYLPWPAIIWVVDIYEMPSAFVIKKAGILTNGSRLKRYYPCLDVGSITKTASTVMLVERNPFD
jgi:hypothetical protein